VKLFQLSMFCDIELGGCGSYP